MSSVKMVRFLNSIGIENVGDFDLEFQVAKLDPENRERLLMVIRKETAWDYFLYEEFAHALQSIDYPYHLSFTYGELAEDKLIAFVKEWYLSQFHLDCAWKISIANNELIFTVGLAGEKQQAERATSLLGEVFAFLNYPYQVRFLMQLDEAAQERYEARRQKEQEYLESARVAKFNLKGNYMELNSLSELDDLSPRNVKVVGEIFEVEAKIANRGMVRASFGIGDGRGAITGLAFENEKMGLSKEFLYSLNEGDRIEVRGRLDFDRTGTTKNLRADYIEKLPPLPLREDLSIEKRVELHLHTKMSAMDAIGDVKRYCAVARNMGMSAIAVTDHGDIQAFPDMQDACKKNGLKPIYGCEFNMFEPHQRYVFNPSTQLLSKARYCVLDLETTGLSAIYDRITEFGGVILENGMVRESLDLFINPKMPIPEKIQAKTRITDEMVADKPTIEELMDKITNFIGDSIIVTHNASFDFGFLNEARKRMGLEPFSNPVIDTLALSHFIFPERRYHSLADLTSNLGLRIYDPDEAHRADFDAEVLSDAWCCILPRIDPKNKLRHCDLMNLDFTDDFFEGYSGEALVKRRRDILASFYKNIRPNHMIALVKNAQGLKDLYKLVSLSNTTYLASDEPRIPKFELEQLHENLLFGSACWNGEVFDAATYRGFEELKKVVSFYDYIEIQPVENYSYLLNMGEMNEERLMQTLHLIIDAAKEVGIPVVATGDCHYVDPEDKIARDVFISTKAVGGGRHPLNPPRRDRMPPFENPDQHFRSTEEMMESFRKWLPEEQCREYVIVNSNWVATQIEEVKPTTTKTYAPDANLPGSAELLRNLCYETLHERYGDNPDPKVVERLEKELSGIIENGYSVTYYIAHRIIAKANEDGYYIGSRGSVGSSFAATMAKITEVNPLPPHYLCPKCKHFEWNGDPKYHSGFDMPHKKCPDCGTEMVRDGQSIPFETFLGFHADKVPDIDLNFPPDYQARAHAFTRELLGADNCFRAGTISTVATKTAFGYVRGYLERQGIDLNTVSSAKITMIAKKCEGVKRTTGQHPGGIVVIPKDMSVFDFTPYQYPADELDSDWLTTHYDFGSMHDEVLKLDLLGQDTPRVLRTLSLMTGVPLTDIPMDDKKVLSLFTSPKALELKHNPLKFTTGALGLPEFGTSFVQGLLNEARPKRFNDLLIISGLSHGTDVWTNNAEDLIKNKTADIDGVIGCRDDIMNYLISKGLPNADAFQIMEKVRKKDSSPSAEQIKMMRDHGVPEYYIESCKKIKYLFPRAHATAYVIDAVRTGWFKLYYPLQFYAAFFTIRCTKWDIATMVAGKEAVLKKIEEYRTRDAGHINPLSEKEKEIEKGLRIAVEMLDRGYRFLPMDLYKSGATDFVVDEKEKALYPPFMVIDNLGADAARSVVEAREEGEFISKEDLYDRTKLSETNITDLSDLGVLNGMGETNQMSIFDF